MDNLTHTLLGAALARTRLQRLSPYATVALIVGANLPDLDAIVRLWAGREGYLVHHRGFSHSLLGVGLQALLIAGALRWLGRRRERRTGEHPGSWTGALALGAVALFSHPALDLLNTYGLRPWLPFDGRWIYGDAVFIVDPWLWLLFGAPALLAGPRTTAGSWTWCALGCLAAGTVALASLAGIVPAPAALVWFACLASLVWVRVRGVGQRNPLACLRCAAAGTILYLLGLWALGQRAQAWGLELVQGELRPDDPIEALTHAPEPADPLHWSVLVETGRAVYVVELHLAAGPRRLRRLDKHADDPVVQAARISTCAAAWRSFVRHPHAALRRDESGSWVELMDARYQIDSGLRSGAQPPRGTWCSAVVRVDQDGAHCPKER